MTKFIVTNEIEKFEAELKTLKIKYPDQLKAIAYDEKRLNELKEQLKKF